MEKNSEIIPTAQCDLNDNTSRIIYAVDIFNEWPRRRLIELTEKYRFQEKYSREELNRMGFDVLQGEVVLIPIEIDLYYENLGLSIPKVLHHIGFAQNKDIVEQKGVLDVIPSFNNFQNMEALGIWGNPSPNAMTFLKPPDSKVIPMSRNGLAYLLKIDPSRLGDVYVDPEMYIPCGDKNFKGAEYDIPGASLAVFGGIPQNAILSYESIELNLLSS